VKIKEIIKALEVFAPLPLQEGYDNAGLQVGLSEAECSGALLCLDVTEAVLEEAVSKGRNLVVAHHPLVFRPLKHVTDQTYVERCLRFAIKNDIAIYAAHTNLDNAEGGVNFEIAERLQLQGVKMLLDNGNGGGSGVIGELAEPMASEDFVAKVKAVFNVECAMCNAYLSRPIRKVALCGGAGDFLLLDALANDADAFITGEMHYHQYFGMEDKLQIVVIGHYQSEQFTMNLIQKILDEKFPQLQTTITSVNTNPIQYI